MLQIVDLLSKVANHRSLVLGNLELGLEIRNLKLEEADVLELVLVLDLSLGKSRLEDLDLLVKKRQLVVTSDELGTKDVSLVNDG